MPGPFLFFAALFPRLTLLAYYLFGVMPPNPTSLVEDVLGAIFVPWLLIAYWLHTSGQSPFLVVLFVALECLSTVRTIRIRHHRALVRRARG